MSLSKRELEKSDAFRLTPEVITDKFNFLFGKLAEQKRRIEELESRIEALEPALEPRAPLHLAEPTVETDTTDAYQEGRQAKREGKDPWDSPYMKEPCDFAKASAFSMGWQDEEDGVSEEQRLEAERNGERV